MAQELLPFDIHVILVEPGSFRTNFLLNFSTPSLGTSPHYDDTILGDELRKIRAVAGKEPGNVDCAADIIVHVVLNHVPTNNKGSVLRLALGDDYIRRIRKKAQRLLDDLDFAETLLRETGTQLNHGY